MIENLYEKINDKSVFHVHTFRCGHAGNEADEEYIKKAIKLGAKSIFFTDHAPFPNDPFTNRMNMSELDGYIFSFRKLKNDYKDKIEIYAGLECEYLPKYYNHYISLQNKVDLLMLGQHHASLDDKHYTFELTPKQKKECYRYLAEGIINGMDTGLFKIVAHPDRIFKGAGDWNDNMREISELIIDIANENDIILEKNARSIRTNEYREEFWNLITKNNKIVYGVDAHSAKELMLI